MRGPFPFASCEDVRHPHVQATSDVNFNIEYRSFDFLPMKFFRFGVKFFRKEMVPSCVQLNVARFPQEQ